MQVRTNPTHFVNTHYWCYLPWKQPNFHFNRLSEVAHESKLTLNVFMRIYTELVKLLYNL